VAGLPESAGGTQANLQLAHRLYRALSEGDLEALVALLTEDFEGDLSPGLPEGFGSSRYVGRRSMLVDGWGRIAARVDLAPVLDDVHATASMIIGRGRYVGRVRGSEALVEARFAHFWTVSDGRLSSVFQVTDTGAWRDALEGHPSWG
jgi:ketosteroid isomerase-like protein